MFPLCNKGNEEGDKSLTESQKAQYGQDGATEVKVGWRQDRPGHLDPGGSDVGGRGTGGGPGSLG